ncbi:MerR family transcriptional regulator [Labrys neptuniae]
MPSAARFFSPTEAAMRLGISAKALRLYEKRGLIAPSRSAAGWRAYGPDTMNRAGEITALRRLGFSLAEVARALQQDGKGLAAALAAQQSATEKRIRDLAATVETIRSLRGDLAGAASAPMGKLGQRSKQAKPAVATFDLPWPWGGEVFELTDIKPLTYIIGPLGSGKTRLALRLAEALPGACFLGLDRLSDAGAAATQTRLATDPALSERVERRLARLVRRGARPSAALTALLAGLEMEGPAILVIDMIEQELDEATQSALGAELRARASNSRPLFMLTRSHAILDLATAGEDEAIILCPANHSPPSLVLPHAGFPGYEAVATCLASPEVRARTQGVIAMRPRSD